MKIQPDCINCRYLSSGDRCQRVTSPMYSQKVLAIGCRVCAQHEGGRKLPAIPDLPQPHRNGP